MGRLILFTGGARSGKSRMAEEMAETLGNKVLYIATAIAMDDEMKDRIAKHKEQRPATWDTHEGYKELGRLFDELDESYEAVLLDCVTIMITNLMYDFLGERMDNASRVEYNAAEEYITGQVAVMLDGIKKCPADVVLVTNEVGFGIVPDNKLARYYRDIAGRINARIAASADEVYLAVCGCKLKIK